MSETKATITATAAEFKYLIVRSALDKTGGDPPWVHSDIYLDIDEESVDVLVSAGGGSVLTYCTFDSSFFADIEGEGVALVEVQPTLDRLGVADGGGRMEFEFVGPEDGDQAETLVANGALEMSVSLPAAEKAMEKVPADLPERWDDEEMFLSPSGNRHKTVIDTASKHVRKIIEAVDLHDNLDYFPIAVEDGEFYLDAGDDLGHLRGELRASVSGPDLKNWYGPGFEALFTTVDGQVVLQTTPGDGGGYPMAVVADEPDHTIRHVLVEVNPA